MYAVHCDKITSRIEKLCYGQDIRADRAYRHPYHHNQKLVHSATQSNNQLCIQNANDICLDPDADETSDFAHVFKTFI